MKSGIGVIFKWINKNSFITVSFCVTVFCMISYLIHNSDETICYKAVPFAILFLNVVLSIRCWMQKIDSPYRAALAVINTAVFVILNLSFAHIIDWSNIKNHLENHLHLNTWDWIAFIVGFITLIFAACTWSSQEKTQKNTLQITPKSQYSLLIDSVRDTYRNLSVVYALDYRMKGLYGQYYPSKEIILRMCIDDRFIFPSLFAEEHEKCCRLQRFRINIRNANIEFKIIANRFMNPNTKKELQEDDVRAIKDRIDGNIKRLHNLLKDLWNYDEKKAEDLRQYITENAANCNDNKSEYIKLFSEAEEKFKSGSLEYFYNGYDSEGKQTEFMKLLFPNSNNSEEADFLMKLNMNIYADAHLFGRIRLIPYDDSKPLICK